MFGKKATGSAALQAPPKANVEAPKIDKSSANDTAKVVTANAAAASRAPKAFSLESAQCAH